jgi:hypothetical protein
MDIDGIVDKFLAIKAVRGNVQVYGDHGEPEIIVIEEEGEFDVCVAAMPSIV